MHFCLGLTVHTMCQWADGTIVWNQALMCCCGGVSPPLKQENVWCHKVRKKIFSWRYLNVFGLTIPLRYHSTAVFNRLLQYSTCIQPFQLHFCKAMSIQCTVTVQPQKHPHQSYEYRYTLHITVISTNLLEIAQMLCLTKLIKMFCNTSLCPC